MGNLDTLAFVAGIVVITLVGLAGGVIIARMATGKIDVTRIISEPNGDASISRFQFLIFTFVVAIGLFFVVLRADPPALPAIPDTVLILLGISGSSYLVSKGIQFSKDDGVKDRRVEVWPVAARLAVGETKQFSAEVAGDPTVPVRWSLDNADATVAEISDKGLYKAKAVPASGEAIIVRAATGDGTIGTAGVIHG